VFGFCRITSDGYYALNSFYPKRSYRITVAAIRVGDFFGFFERFDGHTTIDGNVENNGFELGDWLQQ